MPTGKKGAAGRAKPAGDMYARLVKMFPLRPIRSEEQLAGAREVVDSLMRRELDEGGADYLDVLTDLVEKYEREAHPMPHASEGDVLRLLMESNNLSQPKLTKATGIAQSTLSAVLNGTRELTKDQIKVLSKFFGVSPLVFLPEQDHAE